MVTRRTVVNSQLAHSATSVAKVIALFNSYLLGLARHNLTQFDSAWLFFQYSGVPPKVRGVIVATWPKVLGHHLNATRTPQQSRMLRRGVPAALGYHFLSHSAIAVLFFLCSLLMSQFRTRNAWNTNQVGSKNGVWNHVLPSKGKPWRTVLSRPG